MGSATPKTSTKRGQSGRRGSSFSDKQIAHAVKDGLMVRVNLHPDVTASRLSGFIYGADDFHWGIVTAQGETHLVHKTAPSIQITSTTFADLGDEVADLVKPIISPYRARVMREHFNQPATA